MKNILLLFLIAFLAVSFSANVAYAAGEYESHTISFDANGGRYSHQYAKDFAYRVNQNKPMSLLFVGDSTGNADDEWIYLTSEYLVDIIDNYSISYRLLDDDTSSYNRIDHLQEGPDGDGYALFPGTAYSGIRIKDSDTLNLTGDLDISVKVAITDHDAAGAKSFVDKLGDAGDRGYSFYISDSSVPVLWWSENGTDLTLVNATAAATLEDGVPYWFRVTLDVDNGDDGYDVEFFISEDGSTWNQLGDTVTGLTTTSINENDADIILGSRGAYNDLWEGKYYEAIIKDGIGSLGETLASPDLGNIRTGETEFEDVEGNIYEILGDVEVGFGSPHFTILNASIPGANFSYFSNPTLLNKVVGLQPELVFISLGHNEGSSKDLRIVYNSLIDQIHSLTDDANVVLVTQNPQKTPSTEDAILSHAIRQSQVAVIASENKYGYIDGFNALSADISTYVYTDGVHPTAEGSEVWKDEAIKFFMGAFTNGVEFYHLEVENGEKLTLPDNPVRTGYVFNGWYKNESLTQRFYENQEFIEEDMTLYARWTVAGVGGIGIGEDSAINTRTLIYIAIGAIVVLALLTPLKGKKGRKR